MESRQWLSGVALVAIVVGSAGAQTAPGAGERVRVTSQGSRLVGTLRHWSADSVVVDNGGAMARFRLAEIGLVERQVGTRGRFLHGVAIGALIGGGVGAVGGLAGGGDCNTDAWLCFNRGTMAVVLGILGAGAGVVVGGVAGALSHRAIWETAYTSGRRTAFDVVPVVRPGVLGVGVSMSIR